MKKQRETQLQRAVVKELYRTVQIPSQLEAVEELLREGRELSHKESNALRNALTGLEEKIHVLELRMGTQDAALRKLAMLTPDYYRANIVTPVMQRLISMYDICNQLSQGDIAVMSAMRVFREQILEELDCFGVSPIPVKPGQKFNPSSCMPFRSVPAKTEAEHGTLSEIVQTGFFFVSDEKVIRPAKVVVKQIKKNKTKGE
ncbi:nucleotide exchange factor GrpE [Pontiellaceae bacterium B12227]|nr:nucleotide exchange factor GrpE [Pontiellaceae bacterium B12227]